MLRYRSTLFREDTLRKRTHLIRKLCGLQGLGPLTGRSVVLLLALIYLLVDPIEKSADVISAALAFGLLAIFSLSCISVAVHGVRIRRRLKISPYPPQAPVTTGERARIVLHLTPIRILPGCRLDLSLLFEHPSAEAPTISITGVSESEHRVHTDAVFPHRGDWIVNSVKCELVDALGLVNISWQIPLAVSIMVAPARSEESTLPILSSTQRAGDLVLDTNNRNGDPYDIKPYHPSDGIKKIIWKAFAKRGELLSRHPEASMTPEGHIVIAILAETSDDEICSHALAYIRNLDQMSLEVLVGCLGRGSRPLAHDAVSSEELVINAAWDAATLTQASLQTELTAILDDCRALSQNLVVSKLLLFCDGKHAGVTASKTALFQTATWLHDRGVEPIFCLTEPKQFATSTTQHPLTAFAQRLIIHTPRPSLSGASPLDYQGFLTECLRKKWEVYL